MPQVIPIVDVFHFQHNHKGKFCHKHCNPFKVQELTDLKAEGKRNLSLAEQRFKQVARHKSSFNRMNRQRFGFMLSKICDLDCKARGNVV